MVHKTLPISKQYQDVITTTSSEIKNMTQNGINKLMQSTINFVQNNSSTSSAITSHDQIPVQENPVRKEYIIKDIINKFTDPKNKVIIDRYGTIDDIDWNSVVMSSTPKIILY